MGVGFLICTISQILPKSYAELYLLLVALVIVIISYYIRYSTHKGIEQKLTLKTCTKLNAVAWFVSGIIAVYIYVSSIHVGYKGLFMLILGSFALMVSLVYVVFYKVESEPKMLI